MSYRSEEVAAVRAARERYRGTTTGETAAALEVVGLSAERAAKEGRLHDDMIRVAYKTGAPYGSSPMLAELESRVDRS